MSRALFTAVSGLRNHQVWLDVIGNNIANANTVGYKSSTVVFNDILGQTISSGVAPTASKGGVNPVQVGLGMTIGSIGQNFLQGSIQTTNRNTDMAVQGDGFFVLANGSDRTYSRAGSFSLDANGELVDTATGYKVQGANGDITVNLGSQSTATATTAAQFKGNLDFSAAEGSTYAGTFNVLDSVGSSHTMTITFTKNFTASAGRWDWVVTPAAADTAIGNLTSAAGSVFFNGTGGVVPSATQNLTFEAGVNPGTDVANANAYLGIENAGDIALTGPAGGPTNIRATVAGDDTVSTTGPATSAIAVAAAINSSTAATGVYARATEARVTYTGGTFANNVTLNGAAGQTLVINGVSLNGSLTGTATQRRDALVALINAETTTTGVTATASGTGFVLSAADGRNIAVQTDLTVNATSVNTNIFGFATGLNAATVVARGGVALTAAGTITSTLVPADAAQVGGEGTATATAASQAIGVNYAVGAGVTNPQSITLDFGTTTSTTPLTGVASPSTVTLASQNGVASGTLQNFAVGLDGTITAFYTNGRTATIDTVQLASFANSAGLVKIGTNQYREGAASGEAVVGNPSTGGRGTVVAGSLEMSNVDLAQEFSSMIIAERGFQANARTIATANSMLEELVNLKR
jgi:flagellar hook protein FlgE